MLREKGYNIQLILVGGGVGKPQRHLEQQMRTSDPKGEFVKQYNFIKQTDLPPFLANADIYIFASSCENMPNTLLEGMAAGLPIACSDRGPMPEVLKDGGVYFDPLDPVSISNAIEKIIVNEEFRKEIAQIAKRSSENYSWTITADQTMTFIKRTLKRVKNE
jgi:glycosyltransferase involved in cell wall biosynthesis